MGKSKKPTQRFSLTAEFDFEGTRKEVPVKEGICLISDCLGDAPTEYGVRGKVRLDKDNIQDHAGLDVTLHNISVRNIFSKEPSQITLDTLTLKGHTRTWPLQIAQQLAQAQQRRQLVERLEDARTNPPLLTKVTNRLTADPTSQE